MISYQRLFVTTMVLLVGSVVSAADKPNIVLILSDDQSWTDYSFMGHPDIKTPHLDRLAQRSVLYRRGYVPVALCRPSLATLATGMYPHQHKIIGNDPSPAVGKLDSPEGKQRRAKLIANIDRFPTVPKLLAEQGYISHQSGKWWEGNFQRGGFTHGMTRGFPERGGRHGDDGLKIGRTGLKPVFDFVDGAVKDKKPFFLWYAPFMPHTPHTPPQRLFDKYKKPGRDPKLAKYYAMCEWFDETCGQLVDHLDEKGVRDNTLIVYVCDNGWIQRTSDTKVPDGWRPSFAPRSKQSPYEGGTRTPIMLSWPAKFQPADRGDVVSSIDLVPTILKAAGATVPGNLPGLDLAPSIESGKPLGREAIYGESFSHDIHDLDNIEATLLYRWSIQGKWKLLLTYDGKVNRYNPVHAREEKRPQLFDLLADPHEQKNLAGENPDVVGRMAGNIADWWPVSERKVLTVY